MTDKEKLNDMLDSLIDNKDEQAQIAFHGYLEDKMKDVLGTKVDVDEESDNKEK